MVSNQAENEPSFSPHIGHHDAIIMACHCTLIKHYLMHNELAEIYCTKISKLLT